MLKVERAKFKILLAEDNLINQKVALRILKFAGYESSPVNNGLEAVVAVKENNYDVILMDVQMPEMDGFTATKMIRQLDDPKNKIPIIAITAHALMGDKERCIDAGMDDYVTKPIISEQLISVIDKWLKIELQEEPELAETEEKEEPVFDFLVLEKMSMGDKEFQKELLTSYINDMNERFQKLDTFVREKNIVKVTNEAHTIKGASYSVGAKKIGDEAFGIELSGKQNDLDNIFGRIGVLNKAIEETKVVLNSFLN